MNSRLNISILPAGEWGTALAVPLLSNGHKVKFYFRNPIDSDNFNKTKINLRRLPKIQFNGNSSSTSDLKEAVEGADLLVIACDASHVRDFFIQINPFINDKSSILCISKGIEQDTDLGMSQVLTEIDSKISGRVAVLSGPNFAIEVAKKLPAMTVIASKNPVIAKELQKAFSTDFFRVYTQDDILGVELGGALKNVIAVGVGIGDGLKYGANARAALISRGISEMIIFGMSLGADPLTFAGLSGMGDLVLTCTSDKSRNYSAGFKIGQGVDPKTLIESEETIEGLLTAKAVYDIAKEKDLEVPIMEMVYKIVYGGVKPTDGFNELMRLELSSEDGD